MKNSKIKQLDRHDREAKFDALAAGLLTELPSGADGSRHPHPQGWPVAPVELWPDDLPVFDHPPSFDDSVRLAAELTGSPMAAVTILEDHYQWFKAKHGIPLRGTTREVSFCRFTVESDDVFVVTNARLDARFANNPLVTGEHHVRAYAGAPLVMPDGRRIGAVCVLDTEERTFGPREQQVLELLARQVVGQLQLEQLIHRQARDIDNLQTARAEMRHMAMHDELTGLQNRRGVIFALEQLVMSSHPCMQSVWVDGMAMLYLDLDDFKIINDCRGHEVGDRVLTEVARRLEAVAPPGQILGRLGGDEFIMMINNGSEEEATRAAQRVLQAVKCPMRIDGRQIVVEASIGVAIAERFANVPELIDKADRAMYESKKAGGDGLRVWSALTEANVETGERTINKFVRTCLDDRRLKLHFQPMFDLTTGAMIRREALLRWEGAAPDALNVEGFIAAAENSGLIGEIGKLVLQESCDAAAQWQSEDPGVGVSVNMSALQVLPSLRRDVADALAASGLPAELLTLELTESCILEKTDQSLSVLNEVHRLGVRLALDDFGTGYASMSMLCAFPLDEVKIDRKFCADPNESTIKIVRATVELGHSLGLCVVAEGIETEAMLAELMHSGCDVGQGYLLGRPAAIELTTGQPASIGGTN